MPPYYDDILSTPVPRYTSYPTALQFSSDVATDHYGEALNALGQGTPISLYLHVPYCEAICWYCGCNTGVANRAHRLESYLKALRDEIALIADRMGERSKVVRIAFGGGSPNAISPLQFASLIEALDRHFRIDAEEISVEVDPRNLDREWIEAAAANGVTRISMGVQSFSPEIQKRIGRVQPFGQVARAVTECRLAGIHAINFDLMFGLPGQTLRDLQETLDLALELSPSRIALFGYEHHPEMFPRQRRIDIGLLPGTEERFEQASLGHERVVQAGYRAVGFDHFALPGDSLAGASASGRVRRNFQGFTDDQCEVLIGLGASAISQFPGLIVQNAKGPGIYREILSHGQLATVRGTMRSSDDRRRARIIEALLCNGRAPVPFDLLTPHMCDRLAAFRSRGLIDWVDGKIAIHPQGMPYSRWIAALFDAYRPSPTRLSTVAIADAPMMAA